MQSAESSRLDAEVESGSPLTTFPEEIVAVRIFKKFI